MRHLHIGLTVLLLLFVGTVSWQVRPNAHPSQISMVTAPASDSAAVNLTIPSDVILKTLSARLSGKDVSARTRFAGATTIAGAHAAIANPQAVHANVSALPTLSDFLPPAIAFTTLKSGGYAGGSPWFRVGSQNTCPADPSYSCPGIYAVIVLDRQMLQEKTAAPEKPPNCVSNGTSLKTYLATLNGGDLVIVGSNSSATAAL